MIDKADVKIKMFLAVWQYDEEMCDVFGHACRISISEHFLFDARRIEQKVPVPRDTPAIGCSRASWRRSHHEIRHPVASCLSRTTSGGKTGSLPASFTVWTAGVESLRLLSGATC